MTRILHIVPSADPRTGGPSEGTRQIGAAWARAGHSQDLVTLDEPGIALPPLDGGRIHPLGVPRRRTLPSRYSYAPEAVDWLRANLDRYDAVIVSGLWIYSTMAARRVLPKGRLPYFVYPHGMLDPWFRRIAPVKHFAKRLFWLFNEGPLLAHADAVLFTTEEERERAEGSFLPWRVRGEVVGYGTADVGGDSAAQVAAFVAALPAVAGERFVLFLGRLHPKKGCDLLLRAFAKAAPADVRLVYAGPDAVGTRDALTALAAREGVSERVHFAGMLEGDAKWGAFRACEAFALTSHQENFGVAVAEAMACARPVLISDKVNIWHEVAADGAGLVEPDDLAGSIRLIERFFALPDGERAAIGARGRDSFLARYEVTAVADRLMRLIEARIVARRG